MGEISTRTKGIIIIFRLIKYEGCSKSNDNDLTSWENSEK